MNDEKPEKTVRPVHVYKIPKSVGGATTSIGLVELTAEEELMAEKRAHGDRPRIAVELSKAALVEVNGKPINQEDGTTDTAWDGLSPKVRTLAITAYTKLHIPSDDEMASFYTSVEIRV